MMCILVILMPETPRWDFSSYFHHSASDMIWSLQIRLMLGLPVETLLRDLRLPKIKAVHFLSQKPVRISSGENSFRYRNGVEGRDKYL